MVGRLGRRLRDRSGKIKLGCLLTLAVLGAGTYIGIANAKTYVTYWDMKNEMKVQADFAINLDDEAIRRRLRAKADELKLPAEAKRIAIRRRARPKEISIATQWTVTIDLLVYQLPLTFRPEAVSPL